VQINVTAFYILLLHSSLPKPSQQLLANDLGEQAAYCCHANQVL